MLFLSPKYEHFSVTTGIKIKYSILVLVTSSIDLHIIYTWPYIKSHVSYVCRVRCQINKIIIVIIVGHLEQMNLAHANKPDNDLTFARLSLEQGVKYSFLGFPNDLLFKLSGVVFSEMSLFC